MARDVIEVLVRLGDTILDVAHVGPDETYRIGTAPGVDLAVEGHTSFPLVAGGNLCIPVGVVARECGDTTVLQLAKVTVELTRRQHEVSVVPRPARSWRLASFAVPSLVVHLCLWLCAVMLAPFERIVEPQRPRVRFVHADMTEPPPPPAASYREHDPSQPVSASAAQPRDAERVPGGSQTTSPQQAAASVARMVAGMKVVERVGALRPEDTYNEDDANARGFGGSKRFNPPADTIKTGDGYEVMTFAVKLCEAKSTCMVKGPVPSSYVRANLHEHMAAIVACYRDHAAQAGTIELEFTIAGDGSVRDARGHGLGETGACAARVAATMYFKAIGDNDVAEGRPKLTRVRYPIRFLADV